jgi:AcrR family transcriptional regulator
MKDVLSRMKEDKRIKLINSAMKEFGTNKFDKASTNVIVREANISKGLLFHYFETKEAVFDYLVVFTIKSMGKTIIDNVDWSDGDLINRMHKVINLKLTILEKYPYMFDFGKMMYDSKSIDDVKKITDKYIPDLYYKVYSHNIDFTLFKDNLDVSRVIKIIQLFLDGYSDMMLQKYKKEIISRDDLNKEMEELTTYLEMYKAAFYKKDSVN